MEIESAVIQNGKPVFKDKAGKVIVSPKPIIRPELLKPVPHVTPKLAVKTAEKAERAEKAVAPKVAFKPAAA